MAKPLVDDHGRFFVNTLIKLMAIHSLEIQAIEASYLFKIRHCEFF